MGPTKNRFFPFLPLLTFFVTFLGSGIYFQIKGVPNAFYQISPIVCILPSIALAVALGGKNYKTNLGHIIEGMGHPDVITIGFIFLLAGAFGKLSQTMGSLDTLVYTTLNYLPSSGLTISLFITSALISTAIGTSMGVVAMMVPMATNMAAHGAFPMDIGVATVIGGAMFGDNLSVVSDTTVAAVTTQGANARKKFVLNAKVSILTALLTVSVLFFVSPHPTLSLPAKQPNFLNWLPYLFLFLSIIGWGWNVFAGLLLALSTSVLLAFGRGFSALTVAQSLHEGLTGMNDILILFLFVGALSQLLRVQGGTEQLADKIRQMSGGGKHEYVLAGLVSLFDILLANNTLAILLCGDLARRTARTFSIPPHRSAYLLDTFSCVFQGILPYGAQILLASRLSGVPILTLSSKVYYCHFLFLVAIVEIYLHQKYSEESQRSPHSK